MAFPVIKYNADTGSDTLASGAGPAVAVTGTNGSGLTGPSRLDLNGTFDFTGGSDDGSNLVWIGSTSGTRHLHRITGFTGGITTCTSLALSDTPVVASGLGWAVGGVRQSLDADTSRVDTQDAHAGWTYELQESVAEYTIATTLFIFVGNLADGPVTIRAAVGATPVIGWSTAFTAVENSSSTRNLALEGITFNGPSASGATCVRTGGMLTATNCIFNSARGVLMVSGGKAVITNSTISGVTNEGVLTTGGDHVVLTDCIIHDCGGPGVDNTAGGSLNASGCTFSNNAGAGIDIAAHTSAHMVDVANCSFYNNAGGDILLSGTANVADGPYTFYNNIYSESGAYGFSSASTNFLTIFSDFNAYYSHTSGEVNNVLKGEHSVTLGADPFVSAATGDFTLNEIGNGGALCRDTAYYYGKDVVWGPTLRPGAVVLRYNADSGSDTQASGSGSLPAVFGTNGDGVGSTVVFNETVDLTGVADDGTDVVWFGGGSGVRHLMFITAFNPSIAACTSVNTNGSPAAVTGQDWAIGGVRKTLTQDSARPDMTDAQAGWVYELQDSTAEYTPGAVLAANTGTLTGGPITVRAAAKATPTLSWTNNAVLFQVNGFLNLENLTLTNTTSTSTSANCVNVASGKFARMLGCTMVSHLAVVKSGARAQVIDCDVEGSGDDGLQSVSGSRLSVVGSTIHDCGRDGLGLYSNGNTCSIADSVVSACVRRGVTVSVNGSAATPLIVRSSVFKDGTNSGIHFSAAVNIATGPYVVLNSVFPGNGAYGMEVDGGTSIDLLTYNNNNAFFNNTSGEVSTDITKGPNSITCITDPFVNAAGGDYTLTLLVDGGALLSGTGVPTGWDVGLLQEHGWDIGATQNATPVIAGVLSGQPYDNSADANGWYRVYIQYIAAASEVGNPTMRYLTAFGEFLGEAIEVNRGKGTGFAWPQFEQSGIKPTDYQRCETSYWSPWGGCTVGTNDTFTFTIINDD